MIANACTIAPLAEVELLRPAANADTLAGPQRQLFVLLAACRGRVLGYCLGWPGQLTEVEIIEGPLRGKVVLALSEMVVEHRQRRLGARQRFRLRRIRAARRERSRA